MGKEPARAARRSLAGGGESLHMEVDLNSQVNRCGFTVEDRWFIFSVRNSFECCLDELRVSAYDLFLYNAPMFIKGTSKSHLQDEGQQWELFGTIGATVFQWAYSWGVWTDVDEGKHSL
jgi:hypothetical protein